MKKFLSLLLMLLFVSSVAYGQSSSYYYQKAKDCQRNYEYYLAKSQEAAKWAASYRESAQNASTQSGARDFMYSAQQYEKSSREDYERAMYYAREAEKYKKQADRLAQQGK
jgi:hypothetical protein